MTLLEYEVPILLMQDMAVVLSHMIFTFSFLVFKAFKARKIALSSKTFICNIFSSGSHAPPVAVLP